MPESLVSDDENCAATDSASPESPASPGRSLRPATHVAVICGALALLAWFGSRMSYQGLQSGFADESQQPPLRLLAIIATIAAGSLLARAAGSSRWFVHVRHLMFSTSSRPEQGPRDQGAPGATGKAGRWLGSLGWAGFGLLALAIAITILEYNQPYYFTSDDVFAGGLPPILQGCRSLWMGVFPDWNPYQMLGAPAACLGLTSLLYVPTYLSYAIARSVLGNEFATMDVMAIFHMVIGYLAMFWAGRSAGLRPSLAASGALCFVLAGCTLIMGRSWHAVNAVLVWMPLLVVSLSRLGQGRVGWRWAAGTGLVIGLFYSAGFTQYWIYGMGFYAFAAGLLLIAKQVHWRATLWAGVAIGIGLALLMPMLLMQFHMTEGLTIVEGSYGGGVEIGLWAMLAPWPISNAPHPNGWGDATYMATFYYFGTFSFVAVMIGWAGLVNYRWNAKLVGSNVWLLCATLALILALGSVGLLWDLLSKLPVLNQINHHPFRVLPYVALFCILGGGLVIERLLVQMGRHATGRLEACLAVCVAALMIHNASAAKTSFCTYADTPYPPLDERQRAVLQPDGPEPPQRAIGFAPARSQQINYTQSLLHMFASVYSVHAANGYDPILERSMPLTYVWQLLRDDPLKGAAAYGVRWVIDHQTLYNSRFERHPPKAGEQFWTDSGHHSLELRLSSLSDWFLDYFALADKLIPASHVHTVIPGQMCIRELPNAAPLAFAMAAPSKALPIKFHGQGADIDVAGVEGPAIVNVLHYADMKAYADGRPIPCEGDEWERVRVDVPRDARQLQVRFEPPWGRGIAVGACCMAASVLAAIMVQRMNRVEFKPHA